jgi:hypothetical protein
VGKWRKCLRVCKVVVLIIFVVHSWLAYKDSCFIVLEFMDGTKSGICRCCWIDRGSFGSWMTANNHLRDYFSTFYCFECLFFHLHKYIHNFLFLEF